MKYSREAVLLGAAFFASIAGAEPFTYQGVLQEAGMAADGVYDIRFELYDSDTQGTQLGSTLSFDDVAVSGGTFSVDLDFGNGLFDGSARFLFIEVRDGASGGGYTELLPAIELTATPEALHSLTADTVLNPQWMEAPGVLTYGEGIDRVFINRSSPITFSEYFGVHADRPGFVGMYVSGPADSLPFYGYSVENGGTAYTYLDPSNGEWILNNSGLALTSDSSHNLIAEGDVQGDSFKFNSPKTGYLSIPATAFHTGSGNRYFLSAFSHSVILGDSATGDLYAPVSLPHGAMITRITAYCTDNSSSQLSINLFRITHGGSLSSLIALSTSGMSGSNLEVVGTLNTPLAVDNTANSYSIQAGAFNWPPDFSLSLQSVVIEYTTTEAD